MSAETLRSATVLLSRSEQTPIFDAITQSEAVSLESTRYLGPSANEYYVGLSRLTGDRESVEELFETSEQVLQYVIADGDGSSLVYAQYRNVEPVEELISILYRHDLVVEWPMRHRRAGGDTETRIRVVGTGTGIQRAAADLPSTVSISTEKVGHVRPSDDDAAARLTARQQSLLRHAVQAGYYEVPRETTHRELAESLDLSPGTVSDRLQRIERRVMQSYAERLL